MTYVARFLVWRRPRPDDWHWRPRRRRRILVGAPTITDLKGQLMPKSFASNQIAYFPLKYSAKPPAGTTFNAPVSTENPPVASLALGAVPSQTPPGPDDGGPAVVVTALHQAGGSGGFTVTDSNGDTPGT